MTNQKSKLNKKIVKLNISRFKQTKMMCGPYALKQIFTYYKDDVDIKGIIKGTQARIDWGTWVGMEILFAKKIGYNVECYSNFLEVFDPSWSKLSNEKVAKKLERRFQFKKKQKGQYIGFADYLKLGGKLFLKPITKEVIKKYLNKKIPIFANLDSTYLYKLKRRYKGKPDDIKGNPWGHALVIAGYDKNRFYLIDPSLSALTKNGKYWVNQDLLITCILIQNPYVAAIWK